MFETALTLALLTTPVDGPAHFERNAAESEKLTTLTVDGMTFAARTVKFQGGDGTRTCTLEGAARLRFGDIVVTADRIQCRGTTKFPGALTCTGNCTWEQEDGSGEVFRADKLELQQDGLRLSGHASVRYGSSGHSTVISCDSIAVNHGDEGYELSGEVQLRHLNDPTR